VIIVIGIEESYFMAQFEVGYTLPATKDAAGHHHINGELVVANVETQKRFLKTMEPIWVATKGIPTVVVSPMARYLTKGCCEDPGHLTNRSDPDFGEKMKKDLLDAKYTMKSFLNESSHSHCVVMYPAKDLEDAELSNVWGDDDPTLPLPRVFDKMAAAVKVTKLQADSVGKKRIGSSQGGPPPKKAKKDAGKTGNDGQASNRLLTATKARGKAKGKGAAGAAVGGGRRAIGGSGGNNWRWRGPVHHNMGGHHGGAGFSGYNDGYGGGEQWRGGGGGGWRGGGSRGVGGGRGGRGGGSGVGGGGGGGRGFGNGSWGYRGRGFGGRR
jgi:hypothetical protein